MRTVKLLPRGQLTLPKAVREEAGLSEGDDLVVYVAGKGRIVLETLPPPGSLEELIGTVQPVKPLDVEDARRQAQSERTRQRRERREG